MNNLTYRDALRQAIIEEMQRDEKVFVIGEDVGIFGGTFGVMKGLTDIFGKERILNSPVSEAAIAGVATGAAITGMRPIAEIMFIDFITIAMDQIINQAAKIRYMFGGKAKVPVVFRTQGGGGRCWAAQHSQSLEALFTHIPGLKVVMPSSPYFAKGLLKSAIRDNNPVIFIEHKQLYNLEGPIPKYEYLIPLGKGFLIQEGKDMTIIATSFMVSKVLEAARVLKKKNIDIEIIDPCSLVPLDKKIIIDSIKKTNNVLIVQEACKRMGFGSELIRIINEECFDYLDNAPLVLGAEEVPIPFSDKLEKIALPQVEDIIEIIEKIKL